MKVRFGLIAAAFAVAGSVAQGERPGPSPSTPRAGQSFHGWSVHLRDGNAENRTPVCAAAGAGLYCAAPGIKAARVDPDDGTILVDGEVQHFRTSAAAIRHGIGMVFQHFMLADNFTVLENIILGSEPAHGGRIDFDTARQRVAEIAASSASGALGLPSFSS